MYSCPSCGAELRFDIPSQKLVCDHCGTSISPYQYQDTNEATQDNDTYEVNIFRCPQCGGEIISTSTAAAEFCSYCGASVVLENRLSREKKPVSIIPFSRTKENCKKAYVDKMKQSIFTPNAARDRNCINGFRGIYMPYWMYDVENKGNVEMPSNCSTISADVDAEYYGISYDASSSFNDDISKSLAPYDITHTMKFTPGYLCGFYADTSDVSSNIYEQSAVDFANTDVSKRLCAAEGKQISSTTSVYTIKPNCSGTAEHAKNASSALFPVWFMSYKQGNRVAYATVNGQTGKVCADMPIDIKKYILFSLLLAIPLYLIISFISIGKFTPLQALNISSVIIFAIGIMYYFAMDNIESRAKHFADRGFHNEAKGSYQSHYFDTPQNWSQSQDIGTKIFFGIFLIIVVATFAAGKDAALLFYWIELIGDIILSLFCIHSKKSDKIAKEHSDMLSPHSFISGFIWILIANIILTIISWKKPGNNIMYGGIIAAMLCLGTSFIQLLKCHNKIMTRPLPVFQRKSGDDRA